jgi:hypothetical protein
MLAREIDGIGFKTADRIALNLALPRQRAAHGRVPLHR